MLTISDIRQQADAMLADAEDGEPLDELTSALIRLAVCVSVTSLDVEAIRTAMDDAIRQGASKEQAQEIIALVSGLGVHSLMATSAMLLGDAINTSEADPVRSEYWEKYVGTDPYWAGFAKAFPGFLPALLSLSPAAFKGFFDYCAIPWATRSVRAVTKELAAMACDAAPTHRFGPGFRLHLGNALHLGAGRKAVLQALDIARSAPEHVGVA